jgi:hypothetical protein
MAIAGNARAVSFIVITFPVRKLVYDFLHLIGARDSLVGADAVIARNVLSRFRLAGYFSRFGLNPCHTLCVGSIAAGYR